MPDKKTSIKYLSWIGTALLIAIGVYASILVATYNFHEVVRQELYRSAQLPPEMLSRYVEKHKIRTVLNLRGESPKKAWYREEIATTKKLGIKHIDFKMSSDHELTEKQVTELIKIMRQAPKPLLVHCNHGINRTGLASALYLAALKKESAFTARQQLSLLYGHVSLWFLGVYAMDRTFKRLDPSFDEK